MTAVTPNPQNLARLDGVPLSASRPDCSTWALRSGCFSRLLSGPPTSRSLVAASTIVLEQGKPVDSTSAY